jgi:hypothetical protein
MVQIDSHRSNRRLSDETVVLAFFLSAAIIASFIICGLMTLLLGPLSAWVWLSVLAVEGAAATILAGSIVVGSNENRGFGGASRASS